MRTLVQALTDHELIVLRVIGEWWELDLTGTEKDGCVQKLAGLLAGLDLVKELSFLPPEEAEALLTLAEAGGSMPVPVFSRRFGEVRQMGPARLEREEPWYDPVSPAEALWYRGLLFRGFDEMDEGLGEFFYLPAEIQARFPQQQATVLKEEAEKKYPQLPAPSNVLPARTDAVDDITTILGLAQIHPDLEHHVPVLDPFLLERDPERLGLLLALAWELGLLRQTDQGMKPGRAGVAWLQQGREAQLRQLADAWSRCAWNELRHTPGLICEGDGWDNDPILARTALLDAVPRAEEWFRLDDLVAAIKESTPDFQRPEGDYTTWYVRELDSGRYLRGFEDWDRVEGRLLRFLFAGPLAWLGLVELDAEGKLCRLAPRALAWLGGQPVPEAELSVPASLAATGVLLVPHNANRFHRFQVTRVAEMEPVTPGQPFAYRLTPRSLQLAQSQGIAAERVLAFLAEVTGRQVPAGVKRAIERWREKGSEARLEQLVVLRVADGEILDKLRANPRTSAYLGESLGELAVAVRDAEQLRRAAIQLGLLLDEKA